jgi:hypothetical protein
MKKEKQQPNPNKNGFKRPEPKKRYTAKERARIEAAKEFVDSIERTLKKDPKAFADL